MSLPKLSGFTPAALSPPLPAAVRLYVVGGAVRDELLGRPCSDRDWVVVGATVDDMLARGFTPVGADFPVFLHPSTKEEYALARTERKSGHGYKGFLFHTSPDVTLEEDLRRRDFTINAMAMAADGSLIDPYGGLPDLLSKTLRHVSEAFREDPLRVLRLARFLARLTDFLPHERTLLECRAMVSGGETAHLVAERVFAELNRGMAEADPGRMWSFLAETGLIAQLSKSVPDAWLIPSGPIVRALQSCSGADCRWVNWLLCCEDVAQVQRLSQDLKLPNDLRDLAIVAKKVNLFLADRPSLSVDTLHDLLAQVDVYRKPERLQLALTCLRGCYSDKNIDSSASGLIERCVNSVLTGGFKAAQRTYLAAHADVHPSEAVSAFKLEWIRQHLTEIK